MPVDVELDETGKRIAIRAEWRYTDLCRSLPSAKHEATEGAWMIPLSWSGCLSLRTTFRDDLVVGPRLAAWADHEFTTRVEPSLALREIISLDEGDPDLFPHQRAGVKFLATARRALLADEPGLGKTAQAIRALAAITKLGENPFPAMVVCPNTLKKNWEREFAKWWPGVNVQVIKGTAVQRRKQFATFLDPKEGEPVPHVLIVNWESLRTHSSLAPYGNIALARCLEHGGHDPKVTAARCEVHSRELNRIAFQTVIADEIHRSKDPKSKQTRALWSATGEAKNRFALTGTPIANNVIDLWAILHFLDPDEWPAKSRWVERMVNVVLNAFGGMLVMGLKPGMSDEFHASIDPRMRRMLKDVVLDLPPIIYERRDVEMGAKQKKAYEQMRDHMIAELEDGKYLSAPTALTQMTRLLQFASSYAEIEEVQVEELNEETGELVQKTKIITTLMEPSCKVDAVLDDIVAGDFGDASVAITSVSSQLLELLSARLTKANIDHGMITGDYTDDQRQNAIDDFQSGKTKFILFTDKAGGVGVTLTAAKYLLRIRRPFSFVDDTQARDRVHRIGSEIHDEIIVMDYIVNDTIEEKVLEILERKGQNAEEVVQDGAQLLKLLKEDKVKRP